MLNQNNYLRNQSFHINPLILATLLAYTYEFHLLQLVLLVIVKDNVPLY